MDTRLDEQERCITIKSTGISLYYKKSSDKCSSLLEYLINLIDSPGHVDFSSEVTAALRITDGALVVVDCIEEVCVQTETVLRQALGERIIPILTINKLDRCFIELFLSGEDAYKGFQRVIENVNIILSAYHDESIGVIELTPITDNVSFSAGLHGWSFTLKTFANLYIEKFKKYSTDKLIKKLWGDNFYDSTKKKWSKKKEEDSQRGFVKFCYNPISILIEKCSKECYFEVEVVCKKLKIDNLYQEYSSHFKGKALMKKIMKEWLPAHKALITGIVDYLPSPLIAQQYRTEVLYEGPIDDIYSRSMKKCDSRGPLMMFVSKMIPNFDSTRFLAFGRVFSGKIHAGLKIKIMGSNYIKGTKKDLFHTILQRAVLCMGRRMETVESVSCGNTVALAGLDQYILKNATITTHEEFGAYPIKGLKFSVHPVVRRAIKVKNPNDLPRLLEGLKKLSRSDPLIQVITEENGEQVIAGAGELHLEICIKDLKDDFLQGVEIVTSDPIVPYRETIKSSSNHICMAKSSNKHNRIYATASPMENKLSVDIENGFFDLANKDNEISKVLCDEYNWSKEEAKKIWSFGPFGAGPNILVDTTRSVQYLEEVKDSCVSAFQNTTKEGILTNENIRGVVFYLKDFTLHADSIHRGGGQIIPTCKKVLYACILSANPRLMEPVFLVSVTVPNTVVGAVYSVISNRKGKVIEEVNKSNTPISIVKAYMPVSNSFGFASVLRAETSGQAFPQCVFDHWLMVDIDPFIPESKSNLIVNKIRKRKGLNFELPKICDFQDIL